MEQAGHWHENLVAAAMAAATLIACVLAPVARAQTPFLDELRFGALAHSIEPGHSEGGADVNLELLFRRPAISFGHAFADFVFRPRVHVGASINTIGDTDQIYAGLTWDLKITERLSLEASFGGSWHDGPLSGSAPDRYGCRLNFRESFSIGYALNEAWAIYGSIAHMSNANLCSDNSGISSAGVRIGYKLK
jgi:lipid A 3-O-deacylase